jgi:hypothetical protein
MHPILSTASDLHTTHLAAAEAALSSSDLATFYLHVNICNAINKTLQAYDFPGLGATPSAFNLVALPTQPHELTDSAHQTKTTN